MPKVSIVVPVYNVRQYVEKTIVSLLMQTEKDIEIILVDDGSTDGSGVICDSYAKNDDRIKVLHKINGGLSSARNAGLEIAAGEFFMFVDGDDYLSINAIEYLLEVIHCVEQEIDFVQFVYKEIEVDERVIEDNSEEETTLCTKKEEMFRQLYKLGGVAASACTKIYRRELFADLKFPEGLTHEDEYIITDVLAKTQACLYTNKVLYYYVKRPGSIIKTSFNTKKMDVYKAIEHRIEYLKKQGMEEYIIRENTRYFIILMNMYCEALKTKHKKECREILYRLNVLLKNSEVDVSGKMRLFAQLCKIHSSFVFVYYILKKITKRI